MEAARAALSGAVAALWDGANASLHALGNGNGCASCGYVETTPDAWKSLEKWPVLVRFVVSQWTQMAPVLMAKRSAYKKAKERSVRACIALCLCLHRSGVLACRGMDDDEVVEQLLDAVTVPMNLLGDVLQQRSLTWVVRCRLLQHALVRRRESIEAALELVCVALVDELRNASVQRVSTGRGQSSKRSKKRSRESMSRAGLTGSFAVCETCQLRRPVDGGRAALVRALSSWTQSQEATERMVSTIQAVDDLIGVLNAPDIQHLLESIPFTALRADGQRRLESRRSPDHRRVCWEACDRIVNAICCQSESPVTSVQEARDKIHVKTESGMPSQDSLTIWRQIWRRQRARMGSITTHGSLDELVVMCAIADQVSSLRTDQTYKAETTGVRVLLATAGELGDRNVHTIKLLLQGVSNAIEKYSKSVKRSLIVNPRRYVDCVGSILSRNRLGHDDTKPSQEEKASPMTASIQDVVECTQLVHGIIRGIKSSLRIDLSRLWFSMLCFLTSTPLASSSWSLFVDVVAQTLVVLKEGSSPQVVADFETFVCDIILSIVLTNGQWISCSVGDTTQALEVDIDEASQSTLLALLPVVCTELTERAVGVLVFRLCILREHKPWVSGASTSPFPEGLKRVFFPCLNVFLSSGESCGNALSRIVSAAYARVKATPVDRLSLSRKLVMLLCEWQNYTQRNPFLKSESNLTSLHDAVSETTISVRLVVELGVWQDMVRLYATNLDSLRYETRDFLDFLRSALQHVDKSDCPRDLEGSLFSVASATASLTSSPATTVSNGSHTLSMLGHSDDTIRRFLRVFESCLSRQASRELIQDLVKEGKVEDLVLCLRRWITIACSTIGSVSIDVRHGLLVLANRLVYDEKSPAFDSLRMMMSPVDTALSSALSIFVSSAQSPTAKSSSPVSIVRLNLMVRAYVGLTSGVPNLAVLTNLLVDACLTCADIDVRDSLMKLFVSFSKYVIVEVLVDRVHYELLTWRSKYHIRNTFTLILQARNALYVPLSQEAFSIAIAERWLLPLLIYSTSNDQAATSEPVESLLKFVESFLSTRTEAQRGDVLSRAYPLAALLSTAEVAHMLLVRAGQPPHHLHDISSRLYEELCSVSSASKRHSRSESCFKLIHVTWDHQDQKRQLTDPQIDCTSSMSRVVFVNIDPCNAAVPDGDVRLVPLNWLLSSPRYFLRFTSWIHGTIRWHGSNELIEAAFIEMVLQFYLPIEFHGDSTALVMEWLSAWVTISMQQGAWVILHDFQTALLRQLVGSAGPNSSWQLLCQSAQMLIQDPSEATRGIMACVACTVDVVAFASFYRSHSNVTEVLCGMAADVAMVLSQSRPSQSARRAYAVLSIVSPLIEVFVRVSLIAVSSPGVALEAVKSVNSVMTVVRNQFSVSGAQHNEDESIYSLWNSYVARWKRQYSYLSPHDAFKVFNGLKWQQPES